MVIIGGVYLQFYLVNFYSFLIRVLITFVATILSLSLKEIIADKYAVVRTKKVNLKKHYKKCMIIIQTSNANHH